MQGFERYGRLLFYMVLGVCMHALFFMLWLLTMYDVFLSFSDCVRQ
jgi:hypothetical protein